MQTKRQEFVNKAYQQAREAGLTDSQARLAASQAALETGFGKSVVGNNYFGIKAGSSWQGPAVTAGTWEDEGGKAVKQNARFRSYESPVQSFRDWASTVGRKWSGAFNAPTFGEAVEGLNYGKAGGYATDRKYGSKLRSIDRKYGPQAEQTGGIMQAINPQNVPTPQARPEGLLQMASYAPTPVERRELPAFSPPQQQVSLDTLRQQQPAAQMTPAQQYASYGAGKQPTQLAGLLSQDVAHQGLIASLNAQKQQLQAGINPMDDAAPWKQPGLLTQPAMTQPMADVPQVDPQPTASVAGPVGGGLLSPDEQSMFDAQRAKLSQAPLNSKFGMKAGNFAKGALGGIGGGLLGAALLGPVGGLLGAMLGKSAMTGRVNTAITGHPQAPKSKSQGDGKMTDYGRSVNDSSRQFRDAISKGGIGLY